MGFVSWLTGRNGIYADEKKITQATDRLGELKKNIGDAKDTLAAEIKKLNNCTGFTTYVSDGNLDPHCFDQVIESGEDSIQLLIDNINQKVDDIKTYSEASIGKKVFSTYLMANAKIGEGILSVGEDIIDAGVSVVGWGSGLVKKDCKLQKACENFVKKEWSHDAFNFYYNSNLAKASAFTEDSAIAGGFKIVGSTVGYLALGGALSGAAGAGRAGKAISFVAGNSTRANTTIAAVTGFGSGTEHGLRSGKTMNQAAGSGLLQASLQGGLAYGGGKLGEHMQKQSAIKAANDLDDEAALKLSKAEEIFEEKTGALKTAKSKMEVASKEYETAKESYGKALETGRKIQEESGKALDNAADIARANGDYGPLEKVSKQYENLYDENLKNLVDTRTTLNKASDTFKAAEKGVKAAESDVKIAKEAVSSAKENKALTAKSWVEAESSKLSSYEGYTDPVTKAGQKFGADPGGTIKGVSSKVASKTASKYNAAKTNVGNAKTAISDKVKSTVASRNGAADAEELAAAAKKSTEVFKQGIGETKIGQKVVSLKSGAAATLEKAKDLGVGGSVKAVGKGALNVAKSTPGAVKGAAVASATAAAKNPGTTSAVLNATGREISNKTSALSFDEKAEKQFKKSIEKEKFDDKFDENTSKIKSNGDPSVEQEDIHYEDEYYQGGPEYDGKEYEKQKKVQTRKTGLTKTTNNGDNKKAKDIMDTDIPSDNDKETTITTPPSDTGDDITITTPPSDGTTTNPVGDDVLTNPTGENIKEQNTKQTLHTGGSYSEGTSANNDGGYYNYSGDSYNDTGTTTPDDKTIAGDITTPIDDIIAASSDYTKIPTSTDPITTSSKSGGSSVIPIAAGLSAAAAAGIGAKAYMDRKRNNEDEEEDFTADEWDGDESDIEYNNGEEKENYLEEDNNYEYQEEPEKYGARTNQELADLQ